MVALEREVSRQNYQVYSRPRLRFATAQREDPLYTKFKLMTVLLSEDERAPLEDHGAHEVSHQVIDAAVSGNREAFGEIFKMYKNRIRFYCGQRIKTVDNEDVAQQVWLRAFEHIRDYEYQGSPISSWLYRIARNAVITYHRRAHIEQLNGIRSSAVGVPFEDRVSDASVFANPEAQVVRDALAASIEVIISGLTSAQRDVLSYRYLRGLSVAETAALTGKTENNVKVLAYNGRTKMRRRLEEDGYTRELALG